ncbi:hypothetical protein HanRHA438_Chr03g0107631 [Helianthus annuus]|nr:hypothetical protein HanRHA438_Chr03g0107631 [Helianthus annuus]
MMCSSQSSYLSHKLFLDFLVRVFIFKHFDCYSNSIRKHAFVDITIAACAQERR